MKNGLIPVGVTNRHLHISARDLAILFGEGYTLSKLRDISQKGQFAANETVEVIGPQGRLEKVRIVGPPRAETQLEISPSDAFRLGMSAPVRYSGDLQGTPGVKLVGPRGQLQLDYGVIIPQRHIHMSPRDARNFGVYDRARVMVSPARSLAARNGSEARDVVFDNVLIRVDPSFVLDFHIDTDEANAAQLQNGDLVVIVGFSKLNDHVAGKRLITENDVRKAIMARKKIKIGAETRLTPAARDLGKAHNVFY